MTKQKQRNERNGVLGLDSELYGNTCSDAWANELNFGINHAPDAGLITRPINLNPLRIKVHVVFSPLAFPRFSSSPMKVHVYQRV